MAETDERRDAPEAARSGAASIAARLQRAILEGEYPHQARLPAERELAKFFAASRGTVRAALRQLERKGFLERRVGSGTFVTYQADRDLIDAHVEGTNRSIVELTSPLELIESRLAIEPHMTRLAVLNATPSDLARLHEILERLEGCGGEREAFSRADEEFHLCLASASHNRLIAWLYRKLNEVRTHAQWDAMKRSILDPVSIEQYNREHRGIYQALVNRDADAATRMMTSHLEHARRDLLDARAR